jgi:mannose-6-phosphate isomerase-like protein (cupin superfamily)
MLAKALDSVKVISAGDDTLLSELLHPERDVAPIRFSLAHAVLPPGRSSRRHRLSATETYYVLSGRGIVHVGSEQKEVSRGWAVVIPPGFVQWAENTGDSDLEFLCIVDPPWQEQQEEILDNGRETGV